MRKILMIATFTLCMIYAGICNGQTTNPYIDSVNKYSHQIDSLVFGFYKIPPINLDRIIVHYTCLTGPGGAYVEVYSDSANTQTLQMDYWLNCQMNKRRVFYLLDNKIILIITHDFAQPQTTKKYFKDDVLITIDEQLTNKAADGDLKDGYAKLENILKDDRRRK